MLFNDDWQSHPNQVLIKMWLVIIKIIVGSQIQDYDFSKDHSLWGSGAVKEKSNLEATQKLKISMRNTSECFSDGRYQASILLYWVSTVIYFQFYY